MTALPQVIQEYTRLCHHKKLMQEQIKLVDRNIRQLSGQVKQLMTASEQKVIDIIPTPEEQQIFGNPGSVQLRPRNEFPRLTFERLFKLCFSFVYWINNTQPEVNDGMTNNMYQKAANGIANWLWCNREKREVFTLQRCYLSTEKKKKRKAVDRSVEKKPPKKKNKKTKEEITMPAREDVFDAMRPVFQSSEQQQDDWNPEE